MSAPGTAVALPRSALASAQPSRNRLLRRLSMAVLANPIVVASLVFIVAIATLAAFVQFLPISDPTSQSVIFRLQGPSADHWLGTDRLGRDILSRLLWGARISLVVGVGVVVLSTVLGTLLGVLSGYFRGWLSEVLLRLIDILLAFPPLILAMVTVTVLGPSLLTVVLAISVGSIPRFARVARGTILSIRDRDYVDAARALGTPTWSIVVRHVLLNAVDPLIVFCTLLVPQAILTEALLSFLGLGITEPQPTWGNMINSGQIVLREAPWLTFFPGAAIVLTVLAFNLLGDAIRDALDPAVRDLGASVSSLDAAVPRAAQPTVAQPARAAAN